MKSTSSRTSICRPQFNPIICKGDRLSYENQISLKDRIDNQKWEWICDAYFTKFGRGIVSLGKLEKDTIIVDYHGKVITGQTFEEYVQQPDGSHSFECVWYADWTIWLKLIQLKIIKFEIPN